MGLLSREWGLMRQAWSNGQRGLMIASILFFAATALLAAVVVNNLMKDGPYHPITNRSPQTVIRVTATTVEVAAVKCNKANEDIATEGAIYFRNLDTQELIFGREGIAVRRPGCETIHYVNRIPDGITAGTWRIEGVEITRAGTEEQREPWYTEPFEIPAVEGGQHE